MQTRTALAILLVLYVVWGFIFAQKAPYRQPGILIYQSNTLVPDIGTPDERQHANYLAQVMSGKGFPVLKPGSADLEENYQAHQPPLYYILAAGWSKIVGADPTSPETGRRVRYFNVLIGVVTLLGVYFSALWGLRDEKVALAAVAVTGLMPMFIALNAAITNDSLLYCVCAWTTAFCARSINDGWTLRSASLCGLIVGLGLLTKTLAVALVATVFFALIFTVLLSKKRPPLMSWALALVLPFIVGMPWMIRNVTLYGDPFAINAFQEAFVNSPRPQDVTLPSLALVDSTYNAAFAKAIEADPNTPTRELVDKVYSEVGMTPVAHSKYWTEWVAWWAGRSYIGVLGYMDIFILEKRGAMGASKVFYGSAIGLLVILVFGWALSLKNVTDLAIKTMHATNVALALVVFAMFVKFNLVYFQGQARYLYPAVSATSAALGVGACYWLKGSKDKAWIVLAIVMLLFDWLALQAMSTGFPLRLK